ncbi:undecaprenyldiphospho-muramoylpentapeptide beta-N- acetylglucosaminyltransferase [Legionella birminghamensis]|uniref:UDP-N-acetylglucosamine--N-acetylmuramyl-(pentapeptide) pyrophosphoryl-undecaprenol N-acetylglucosamine transferase n=1 Tax=Legionella birminghamensis TaxID=28083 RepID=A0A378IAL9_9GAMM|nr:undecaprenyldiphospho-muramoylpentapeptide beta-N-acetylglucosaminyltransferase [Legionella birminghamensis]KTC76088.1 undecaprenyldiphospho-muramoylpentapeptide beta-N- acetylglucosaminyltransferase [Legionella birminghamensis]STX32288.1 UDP-N-acetylglucosamine-N-acetylmuramyl-(pentapeptide) pyrophosphoryl-undecaprenol N-acetylglucosamine transferase [Legionella birminghamensis]
MSQRIVLTGGGTAGHVTPNLALIEVLKEENWQIDYIGSKNGVEEKMIKAVNVPFHAISSGKLRRYFSWQNFLDPFLILKGIVQSFCLLKRLQTEVVFSKGGFVAFPVVFAAWLRGIPVIAHESDLTPGLANRLSFPFVNKIAVNFDTASKHFKQKEKVEVTGTPIRSALFRGDKQKGLALCGFNIEKPCLLVMGGSLGAAKLNDVIRKSLPALTREFQVIHLCGKGKLDLSLNNSSYHQLEYADEELPHLFAASDLIISRAGANSIYEILALQKPHILIPLSARVSRGDQIQNARYFKQQNISVVLDDDLFDETDLLKAIEEVKEGREHILDNIRLLGIESATEKVLALIKELLRVESPKAV